MLRVHGQESQSYDCRDKKTSNPSSLKALDKMACTNNRLKKSLVEDVGHYKKRRRAHQTERRKGQDHIAQTVSYHAIMGFRIVNK